MIATESLALGVGNFRSDSKNTVFFLLSVMRHHVITRTDILIMRISSVFYGNYFCFLE